MMRYSSYVFQWDIKRNSFNRDCLFLIRFRGFSSQRVQKPIIHTQWNRFSLNFHHNPERSGHTFAHASTAELSWDTHNYDLNSWIIFCVYEQRVFLQDLNYGLLNPLWDRSQSMVIYMIGMVAVERTSCIYWLYTNTILGLHVVQPNDFFAVLFWTMTQEWPIFLWKFTQS